MSKHQEWLHNNSDWFQKYLQTVIMSINFKLLSGNPGLETEKLFMMEVVIKTLIVDHLEWKVPKYT